jgi:hypothetical protein
VKYFPYILSGLYGVLALPLIAANNLAAFEQFILRRRAPSWIPLLGGLLGVAALRTLPIQGLRDYWWLPLFLDWGSIPGMSHVIWVRARRHRKSKTRRKE